MGRVFSRFHLLKYGLAIVLVFIGGKMLAMPWFHMPIQWSLTIVGSIIAVSVLRLVGPQALAHAVGVAPGSTSSGTK